MLPAILLRRNPAPLPGFSFAPASRARRSVLFPRFPSFVMKRSNPDIEGTRRHGGRHEANGEPEKKSHSRASHIAANSGAVSSFVAWIRTPSCGRSVRPLVFSLRQAALFIKKPRLPSGDPWRASRRGRWLLQRVAEKARQQGSLTIRVGHGRAGTANLSWRWHWSSGGASPNAGILHACTMTTRGATASGC